jgi:hypothetical protein
VWKRNVAYGRDGCEKAEHISEENIKEDIWTSSRTRNRTNDNYRAIARNMYKLKHNNGHYKKRLKWIGHLVKMDCERVLNKILESEPEGRRRMKRTRMRWSEDFEKNLKEKFKRWRQKTEDREKWASAINETMLLEVRCDKK